MQPFSLLLGLGSLAGLLLAGWRAPQKERIRYLDAAVWVLAGALLISRGVSVTVNWSYYQAHLSEIYQVWLGGLSGIGAFIGGILSVLIIATWWKMPAGILADTLLPLAGTLTVFAWLGCWVDRCSYGAPASAWWAIPGQDEWGVTANRVPVQLLGAVITLFIIWRLDRTGKRTPVPGMRATIGLLGISAVIFGLSFLRADPGLAWNGLRLEAWGAIGLMIFSTIAVVVLLLGWKYKKKANPSEQVSIQGRWK